MKFSSWVKFYKFGVKDFFLNGALEQHVNLSFQHVLDRMHKALLRAVLHDILAHQFVVFQGRRYLSKLGSGQGQILSGDLTLAFFRRTLFVPIVESKSGRLGFSKPSFRIQCIAQHSFHRFVF